ncbi:DNA-formamidopyrimidine glycosylase [Megasphaera sp.]|uniref:DNA-formamidopyrimidine glycosylase n=2 Tax=Megasphaera TaxID=906 RepID=UPI0025E8EBEF|nr:DNA-formamidopyrimidine glycosylase [uncultured Megasphaera sp.]
MPELPEVETVRTYLDGHLRGRRIENVAVGLPRLVKNRTPEDFAASLSGCAFTSVSRRGKYLILHLDAPWDLLVHLRMTGSLLYGEKKDEYGERFVHLVFTLDKGYLFYRDIRTFGCLWLVPKDGPTGVKGYDSLGPDAVGPDFTADYLYKSLKKSHRFVKAFLLDQTKVAGLGNIYVDEALFLAHIRPQRRCDKVTKKEAAALYEGIGKVLRQGLAHGGTTIRDFISGNGKEGQNQAFLNVYGREGQPCPLCGTPIRYEKQGGRGTHYCPICQK